MLSTSVQCVVPTSIPSQSFVFPPAQAIDPALNQAEPITPHRGQLFSSIVQRSGRSPFELTSHLTFLSAPPGSPNHSLSASPRTSSLPSSSPPPISSSPIPDSSPIRPSTLSENSDSDSESDSHDSSLELPSPTTSSSYLATSSLVKKKNKNKKNKKNTVKANRATFSNPIYGWVDGAWRGGKEQMIFRQCRLCKVEHRSKKVLARFLNQMTDIIDRSERLAVKTGCWLFVAGQHSTATSPNSFLHYSSPATLRDHYDDAVNLINTFGSATSRMVAANRNTVGEVNEQLKEQQQKTCDAETAAQAMAKQLADAADKNTLLMATIQHMEAAVGSKALAGAEALAMLSRASP
ncbi:hypothetical protein DXG01_016465 [Tephrocybe rancida]|nr:hypothetical protein DXG01_016465 [Tephrocybe rancida]